MKQNKHVKNLFETLFQKAESMGRAEMIRTNGAVNLVDTLKIDMLNYLLYLCLSDGEIQNEEIKYINKLLGYSFDKASIEKHIARNHLDSDEFLKTVPASLPYFVRQSNGVELVMGLHTFDLRQLYTSTFYNVGRELIATNHFVSQSEVDALTKYGILLDVYIKQIVTADENTRVVLPYRQGETPKEAENGEVEFTGTITQPEPEVNLDSLYEELMGLTGMESVKQEVGNIVNLLKISKLRQDQGLSVPDVSRHLVFLGNPGTGKTTVARILSKIYYALGILSKGQMVEVDRSGLVSGYMGQTGEKVNKVIEQAKGGVLFIDEAYALAHNKSEGDFGQEAIDILNKAMEDNRADLIVIAAGYDKEMNAFLDANPGMRSRFNKYIHFPDYSAEELLTIITNRAERLDYKFSDEAVAYLKKKFELLMENPPENFGNARAVRNYLEEAMSHQANRLMESGDVNKDNLMTIELQDVEKLNL